jgi:hypothetical protein
MCTNLVIELKQIEVSMKTIIIIFFLIYVKSAFAQLSVGFSAGVDPKEISLYNYAATDGNNAYWNNGVSMGANIEYSLSKRTLISALFHYSHYSFNKYANTGLSYPEKKFLYAEGEHTNLWRTSFELKYFPFSQDKFRFFILSGLGIIVEDFGTIKTHYSNTFAGGNQTYIIDSEIKNRFVHSLGLGFRSTIISNLFIDISGLYYSDYDERFQTFFGLNVGYQIM